MACCMVRAQCGVLMVAAIVVCGTKGSKSMAMSYTNGEMGQRMKAVFKCIVMLLVAAVISLQTWTNEKV